MRAAGRGVHRARSATARVVSLAIVFAIGGAVTTATFAADVAVRAELDRPRIAVGESADLAVTVEGAQDAPAPSIGDVDGLSVRYVGPATQLSIVNGRTSASITHHFSVSATKPGRFTIGPIAVEYGGKRYDAGTVTVESGGPPPAAPDNRRGAPAADQVTLALASPRTRAYLHERVPVTLTLTVGAVQVSDVHYPTIGGDGFALEPLREPAQRREQTAHGVVQIVDFQSVLTPLRAGDLTLGPATIELSVPVRGGRDQFFDRFLGGDPFGARRPITVHSEPLHLEVLPLPDAGKPADFSGAVGSFELHVAASPRELKAGDPVTITTTIEGDGNLDGIAPPVVADADALKTYPVQPIAQPSSNPTAAGGRARIAYEQVVIPERAGTFTLAAPRFSYFDPAAGAYRTLTAPPIALAVQASAQPAAQAPVGAPAATPARAAAPETLGRDIVFIKDTPGALTPIGRRLYRSATFWALQLVPLALWMAVAMYDRRRKLLRADPRLARFATAGRSARRAIAGAEAALRAGDRATFYDGLAAALREYLSAKLDLPPGAITADGVAEHVHARGVSPEVAQGLHELLATCERVRFAPQAAADGDMRAALDHAASLVRALERERRLGSASARVALVLAIVGATMRIAVVLAIVAAGALAPRLLHADAAPSPNTIFFHANALYGEERYTDAAAEYERVLAGGVESGPLYFNLGNAYFKTGDVGRAVLAYERARRLMPADPDLQANLRFAREGAEPDAPPLVARLLFPLATRLASDPLLRVASGLWIAVVLLATLRRLVPALDVLGRRATAGFGVLLLIVATSAAYRVLAIELPSWAVVVAPQGATVRFEPSASGTAHFTTTAGAKLRVLTARDQWAQVERADGTRGWIAADAIARL
jgi:tetratricopeptide (TPR) repeat protein